MAELKQKDLKAILKDINKKFGDGAAQIGVNKKSVSKFSLGTPSLDYMTYCSIPEGSWIELSGAEHSGKTLLSYLIAADYIRKESKKAEEERRHIVFIDAEGTADPEWAYTSTHYDMNDPTIQTYYIPGVGQSAEQLFDICRDFAASGQIGLIIFDSLTAIAPQQNNNESFEKKDMGGISKPLADFVKRCTGLFNKNKTTFIGINGSITNIGGYGNPETTGGGTYYRRACSLRLRVRKGKYFDEDGNELTNSAENPAGTILEVALLKSKFCRGDRRLGITHLNYRKGIDILWDTIDMATNIGFIDDSTQGSFKFVDPDTGEYLTDENGEVLKVRGRKNLKPYFEEHPDLWKRMYDKIYEKIAIKDDMSIKSFEEVLGINMYEKYGAMDGDEDMDLNSNEEEFDGESNAN